MSIKRRRKMPYPAKVRQNKMTWIVKVKSIVIKQKEIIEKLMGFFSLTVKSIHI